MTGPCAPWITTEDPLWTCDVDLEVSANAALVAAMIAVSSSALYVRTHRRFPGICSADEWLCSHRAPCGGLSWGWCGSCWGQSRWSAISTGTGSWVNCAPCQERSSCDCGTPDRIRLPFRPVVEVTAVYVDGVLVDPGDYVVRGDWIYRCEGTWPECVDVCDGKGLRIEWSWGTAPPPDGVLAAAVLGCELTKAHTGGPCRIPKRVTNVVRSGVTWELENLIAIEAGRFGIPEVDSFLLGPWGDAPAAVLFPEQVEPLDFDRHARVWPR